MSRVARSYVDALGTMRAAADETVAHFEELLVEEASGVTAAAIVVRDDETLTVDVTLPAIAWPETLHWTLLREDGESEQGEIALRDAAVRHAEHRADGTYDTRRVPIAAAVPLGTHRLTLVVHAYANAVVHVVGVPARAVAPAGRTWGIALQLYTLRSARNLGIGDFADLRAVCALLGARGASYVGINPLHAPVFHDPESASPYSASSRRWLNWLYIAVDDVPEFRAPAASAAMHDVTFASAVEAARAPEMVGYAAVAACKQTILSYCYDALEQNAERLAAFDAWCVEQGEPLLRFAMFDVLVRRFGRDVTQWPPAYQSPDAPDVALLAAAEHDAVRFLMYLQFLAAEQLAAVAADAARHGVGLYRDLAVGVDANAADVWADRAAYLSGVSVGAPPDVLNTLGQDWGLPPPDPRALARDGYAGLLALLRANCRNAGALRIDHAFSLARLYWIPRGAGARTGTYVTYPLDDLAGVTALASVRENCVVIGEDLGTVPDGFRDRMEAVGILSYRILFFERTSDGGFAAPEAYPALALAASGTHDLATLPAWLRGEDIELRHRLGLLETPPEREHAARERERTRLLDALVAHGDLAPAERDDETAIVIAANRYLAATPCAIVMAQLDDVLGERAPVNVPGTSTQYPNWRRKLGTDVDALASDERLTRLCSALSTIRPRPS